MRLYPPRRLHCCDLPEAFGKYGAYVKCDHGRWFRYGFPASIPDGWMRVPSWFARIKVRNRV